MSNVVDFVAYRAADDVERQKIAQSVKPIFEPGLWPGNDYNDIGHDFRALAKLIRESSPRDPASLADVMERYSVACFAISENVREIEYRMMKAEKALRPKGALKRVPGAERPLAIRYGLKKYKAKRKRCKCVHSCEA